MLYFVLLCLGVSNLHASIASAPYVSKYYMDMCNNPNLNIDSGAGIASVSSVMQIIDSLNTIPIEYDTSIVNNIASVGWVKESLDLLSESEKCCLGGVVGWGTGVCRSCGVWMRNESYKCTDAGVYRNGTKCEPCVAGWICPAGTAGRVMCGAGFYCVNNVRHECTYGLRQCPYNAHTELPDVVACNNTTIFTTTPDLGCTGDGVYRNGTTCSTCPDGWWCPSGTSGRVRCGSGFFCTDGVRTPCDGGVNQCPDYFHTSQPTTETV